MTNRQHGDVTSRLIGGGDGPRAFTLLELLLVIAIVSMLVAMSFPTLVGVRQAARMTQSLSNNRGLWAATMAYREDNRQNLPIRFNMPGSVATWSSWFYGGKHCDERWTKNVFLRLYDLPPSQRPLNRYVMPDAVFTDPLNKSTPVPPEPRRAEQAEAFRSPGDRMTFQDDSRTYPTAVLTRSSYDDVGTSYHMNLRWIGKVRRMLNDRWSEFGGRPSAYDQEKMIGTEGNRRFFLADQYNPGRVIFLHDQTVDVVANDPQKRDWMGEFGELNKGVVTFIGGSSAYITITPGASTTATYSFDPFSDSID